MQSDHACACFVRITNFLELSSPFLSPGRKSENCAPAVAGVHLRGLGVDHNVAFLVLNLAPLRRPPSEHDF